MIGLQSPTLFGLMFALALGGCTKAQAADGEYREAENALAYQRNTGGWPKNYDRKAVLTKQQLPAVLGARAKLDSTIDNGATYQEIRILADAYRKSGDTRYRDAAVRGIEFLLAAQYDNGGWPQYYPRATGYHQHITYNDDAMIGVMELFRDIVEKEPGLEFVSEKIHSRCDTALEKGLECILKTQVVLDGQRTVWCAQHDRETFKPAKARSYELASLSGAESVRIVQYLMGIEKPDPAVIEAIEGAVAWFDRVQLRGIRQVAVNAPGTAKGTDKQIVADSDAPPLWARFYDLKTQKPFFCSRDGVPRASIAEISYERRNGYSWLGEYARELLDEQYPAWKQ